MDDNSFKIRVNKSIIPVHNALDCLRGYHTIHGMVADQLNSQTVKCTFCGEVVTTINYWKGVLSKMVREREERNRGQDK